jgi:hypothetical protein
LFLTAAFNHQVILNRSYIADGLKKSLTKRLIKKPS